MDIDRRSSSSKFIVVIFLFHSKKKQQSIDNLAIEVFQLVAGFFIAHL